MAEPNKPPGGQSNSQHLKFNRNVIPDLRRLPGTLAGAERKLAGEGRTLAVEETDSLFKWIGLAILMLLVAAVVGLTLRKGWGRGDVAEPTPGEELERERSEAREVISAYMATGSVAERSRYVRRGEAMKPLMEAYYSQNEIYPLRVWNHAVVEPRSIDGRSFWYAVALTPESREILLLEQVEGTFKVDWETHVGYNPMPPEDYLRERPTGEMDFRVYVSPVEYYNGPFGDAEKYLSAKLEFGRSDVVIFGYIDKASPCFQRIKELVDKQKQVPLILTLEWPVISDPSAPGEKLPQVHIRDLVGERWLVLD